MQRDQLWLCALLAALAACAQAAPVTADPSPAELQVRAASLAHVVALLS